MDLEYLQTSGPYRLQIKELRFRSKKKKIEELETKLEAYERMEKRFQRIEAILEHNDLGIE